ncbi:MAG: hypothetical protein KAS32_13325 [Candidatus Peribacteraceae bacterium]|nr:hypothetical protein [Candidatus Peribacteraceae bacterium]
MRLQGYMRLSSPDDDSSTFRSLKIGITKDDRKYADIVGRLAETHHYLTDSISLVKRMNKIFRSSCKGMYRFKYRLCVDEDIHPSTLDIDSSIRRKLLMMSHELNDDLSQIKKRFEEDIRNI